jgi:hypothetical protein
MLGSANRGTKKEWTVEQGRYVGEVDAVLPYVVVALCIVPFKAVISHLRH